MGGEKENTERERERERSNGQRKEERKEKMDDLPIILCFLFPYFGFGPEYEYRCPPGPEWGEGGGKIPSILSIEMFNRSMPIGFKDVRFNNIVSKVKVCFWKTRRKPMDLSFHFQEERGLKNEKERRERKRKKRGLKNERERNREREIRGRRGKES